VGADASSARP